jgi:hypothetical protein
LRLPATGDNGVINKPFQFSMRQMFGVVALKEKGDATTRLV